MRCRKLLTSVVAAALFSSAEPIDLDYKADKLDYLGYTFQKTYDAKTSEWTLEARKDGTLVYTFGQALEPAHLSFGLVKLLRGDSKQVAVEVYSGGAHCCANDWIVSVDPEFRVLMDTEGDVHGMNDAVDVDGDGNYEFSINTITFDYYRTPYAWSPHGSVWFMYEPQSGKFVPANDRCFDEIKKQVDLIVADLRAGSWKSDLDPDHELRREVLDVVIDYLYAGHDREAWAFFDVAYPAEDRDDVKKEVMEYVSHEPFYEALQKPFGQRGER